MRELLHLDLLKGAKSLLAFSGGVDSSALFHLLREHNITFDIAHVNYHTRPNSDEEALYAQTLAKEHHILCHSHSRKLPRNNFEHHAREERYRFFEELIHLHSYSYLLTAHQLNDRLEWMLMQLCKGSGLPELLGSRSIECRNDITIIRPLLDHDRKSIEAYLRDNNLKSFIDESNHDLHYKRNRFRHTYAQPMMDKYADAIRRSFSYLQNDADTLIDSMEFVIEGEFSYARNSDTKRSQVYGIDREMKRRGIVLTQHDKETLQTSVECIISRRFVVWQNKTYTFVAPYLRGAKMDKRFKEECRQLKIAPKIRPFLANHCKEFEIIRRLIDAQALLQSD